MPGQVVRESIAPIGDFDRYRFSAASGQSYFLVSDSVSGAPSGLHMTVDDSTVNYGGIFVGAHPLSSRRIEPPRRPGPYLRRCEFPVQRSALQLQPLDAEGPAGSASSTPIPSRRARSTGHLSWGFDRLRGARLPRRPRPVHGDRDPWRQGGRVRPPARFPRGSATSSSGSSPPRGTRW